MFTYSTMPRLCARKRKLLVMVASFTTILITGAVYIRTDESLYESVKVSSVDIPSDYEFNSPPHISETGKKIGDVRRHQLTLVEKRGPSGAIVAQNRQGGLDANMVDRKPQAHNDNEDYYQHPPQGVAPPHGRGMEADAAGSVAVKMYKFKFARDLDNTGNNNNVNGAPAPGGALKFPEGQEDAAKRDDAVYSDEEDLKDDEDTKYDNDDDEDAEGKDNGDDNDNNDVNDNEKDDDDDDDNVNDNLNDNVNDDIDQNNNDANGLIAGDEGYVYDNPPFHTGDFDYSLLKNYTKANTTALIKEVIANTQEHRSRSRSLPTLHMQASRLLYFVQNHKGLYDDETEDEPAGKDGHSKHVAKQQAASKNKLGTGQLGPSLNLNNRRNSIHGKVSPTVTTVDEERPATQIQMPSLLWRPGIVHSNQGQFPIVKDTIYWSREVENFVPKGISDSEVNSMVGRVAKQHVSQMLPPLWNRCGRPKNQYIVMEDGTALCARYRDPHNKLIQGELLSFYLARYLGLDNVPMVVISQANSSLPQWRGHDLGKVNWSEGKVTALIQWISGLDSERSRVRMPSVILSCYEQGRSLTLRDPMLPYLTPEQLSELVQWTDMIVFDYITGHYDRVASMQDGAEREKRPSVMGESIRNLRQTPNDGKIWLIDNESGLFDAYELMYRGKAMGQRFIEFHRVMLRTICLFRRELVDKLAKLVAEPNPERLLVEFANFQDSSYRVVPRTPQYALFKKHFHRRLKDVHDWMQSCKNR